MDIPDIEGLGPNCIGQIVTIHVDTKDSQHIDEDYVGLLAGYTVGPLRVAFFFRDRPDLVFMHANYDVEVVIFNPTVNPALMGLEVR